MSTGFQEHKVLLCLDKDLYRAFIRLQADKDLGRSYAGLLPYVEGLYRMGYITKDVYDVHFKKYSEPLIPKIEESETTDQNRAKTMLKQKDKLFLAMIEQFNLHSSNSTWMSRCQKAAEEFKDRLESARALLELIDKATVQSKPTVQSSDGLNAEVKGPCDVLNGHNRFTEATK
ncbi:MAG: hypothetical protein WAP47_16985 [Candidatus Rokuibacteriota bacterium]